MRGFSPEEEERIREGLIESGRERFSRYGMDKTTIQELTEDVDIAKGSFYRFFDSKENLYLEILKRERERVSEPILQDLEEASDPEEGLEILLTVTLDMLENNDLLRQVFLEGDLKQFIRQASDDKVEETAYHGIDMIRPVLSDWQENGVLHEADPEIMMFVLRAGVLGLLESKEFFGEDYEEVRNLLIEVLAKGLASQSNH